MVILTGALEVLIKDVRLVTESINMDNGLVFLTIYIIVTLTLCSGYDLVCGTGHYVTSEVKVNFTVREKDGFFGCMEGLSSDDSMNYPGSPEEVSYTVSRVDANFTLRWKPPDDSSIQDVTGFLVEMFVEDYGKTMDTGASKCYLIESNLAVPLSRGEVPQDTLFQLDCTMNEELNVMISVTSLPAPAVGRSYKEASIQVVFQGPSTKSTQSFVHSRTSSNHQMDSKGGDDTDDDDDDTSLLTMLLVVVGISFVVMATVIYFVHRHRNHTYRVTLSEQDKGSDSKHSSFPGDHFDRYNVKDIMSYCKGNTNFRNQNIGITSIVNPLHNHLTEVSDKTSHNNEVTSRKSSTVSIDCVDNMNDIGDIVGGSLPESYRLKIQAINTES